MVSVSSIPINQVILLLEGAKRSGLTTELLLQECGIDVGLLNDAEGRVDKKSFIHLMLAVPPMMKLLSALNPAASCCFVHTSLRLWCF